MKILIVEDERELMNGISEYLSEEKYQCEFATTFDQAMDKVQAHHYDCVLLDLMLPGGDGMEILDVLKKQGRQEGVIIISAKGSVDDKIKGLQLSADDYLAKPFHLSELAARVFAIIRRRQFENSNTLSQKEIAIDLLSKTVSVAGRAVILTKKEFDLLIFFVGNRNKVISKGTLAEHLSGDVAEMFDNHDFVYAHVKNLKRKLNEADYGGYLKTVYGTGYKWEI